MTALLLQLCDDLHRLQASQAGNPRHNMTDQMPKLPLDEPVSLRHAASAVGALHQQADLEYLRRLLKQCMAMWCQLANQRQQYQHLARLL